MKGLSVNWIINFKDKKNIGKQFLKALLKAESMEIYECESIFALVEFLYGHYRDYIKYNRFPQYFFQLIVYYSTIAINENLYNLTQDPSIVCSEKQFSAGEYVTTKCEILLYAK